MIATKKLLLIITITLSALNSVFSNYKKISMRTLREEKTSKPLFRVNIENYSNEIDYPLKASQRQLINYAKELIKRHGVFKQSYQQVVQQNSREIFSSFKETKTELDKYFGSYKLSEVSTENINLFSGKYSFDDVLTIIETIVGFLVFKDKTNFFSILSGIVGPTDNERAKNYLWCNDFAHLSAMMYGFHINKSLWQPSNYHSVCLQASVLYYSFFKEVEARILTLKSDVAKWGGVGIMNFLVMQRKTSLFLL